MARTTTILVNAAALGAGSPIAAVEHTFAAGSTTFSVSAVVIVAQNTQLVTPVRVGFMAAAVAPSSTAASRTEFVQEPEEVTIYPPSYPSRVQLESKFYPCNNLLYLWVDGPTAHPGATVTVRVTEQ